jgi:hypothetical protein
MREVKYCNISYLRIVACPGRKTPIGFIPKGQGEDGYGRKISTEYEVRLEGHGERWYKVYASCISNVAAFYTDQGYCRGWQLDEQIRDAKKLERTWLR